MPKKALITYAVICSVVMLALNAGKFSVFSGVLKFEVYLAFAGFMLILFGVYMGIQWVTKRSDTKLELTTSNTTNPWGLSQRELDVLGLLCSGHTNQEAADKLHVSLPTIKTHTSNIYAKMGVKRRTQAVQEAIKSGLIVTHTKD